MPRILHCSRLFYLENSNGAAISNRSLMQCLARRGFGVAALCGSVADANHGVDPAAFLRGNDPGLRRTDVEQGDAWSSIAPGVSMAAAPKLAATIDGVPITIHRRPLRMNGPVDDGEVGEFLSLFDSVFDQFRPDILVAYGGDAPILEVLSRARRRGVSTVFTIHNFAYMNTSAFADVDAVLVASQFSAEYHRGALGLECTAIPYLLNLGRVRAESRDPRYLTFVNPSIEKGVYPFARIADELGRRRPDIPILVVEGRGTEATVAACGLELRDHGTVHFMGHTADPREFWGVTKVCLLPSLWWENQLLVAVEAMANGIPVIGSDRGGIPETLGNAGIVLPLPERITQATRILPTAEEVEPWVQAVIRLWDDAGFHEEHRQRALVEARRWEPEILGPRYVEFFEGLRPGPKPKPNNPPGRARSVVLVPYLNVIERECEEALRGLEAAGVRVVRSGGNSAIDVARNRLASEALHDGAESLFFIDSDIGFDPRDALRLLARPEPVVAGVYAKKGNRQFASIFADDVDEVVFGAHASGLYPLKYAATGFLRIKARVLRRMIEELDLPHCNTHWGQGDWPFFQPFVVPQGEGRLHYLGEDWAFSHRLARIGVTPMADTSIRLWHYGRHAYGWEDVGFEFKRFSTLTHRFRE